MPPLGAVGAMGLALRKTALLPIENLASKPPSRTAQFRQLDGFGQLPRNDLFFQLGLFQPKIAMPVLQPDDVIGLKARRSLGVQRSCRTDGVRFG